MKELVDFLVCDLLRGARGLVIEEHRERLFAELTCAATPYGVLGSYGVFVHDLFTMINVSILEGRYDLARRRLRELAEALRLAGLDEREVGRAVRLAAAEITVAEALGRDAAFDAYRSVRELLEPLVDRAVEAYDRLYTSVSTILFRDIIEAGRLP